MALQNLIRTKINSTPCQIRLHCEQHACWNGKIISFIVCVVNLVN